MPEPKTPEPTHADIILRIDLVEKKLVVGLRDVALVATAQSEFLFGGPSGPGLAELVRQHDRWITAQRRAFLVIVPAVVIGVCAVIWEAVVASLHVLPE